VAKLEEAIAQLLVELNAARSRLAEGKLHKQGMTFDYEGLCRDFDDLRTSHNAIVKEKAYPDKMEHGKAH
jgi:hypothetical protein